MFDISDMWFLIPVLFYIIAFIDPVDKWRKRHPAPKRSAFTYVDEKDIVYTITSNGKTRRVSWKEFCKNMSGRLPRKTIRALIKHPYHAAEFMGY